MKYQWFVFALLDCFSCIGIDLKDDTIRDPVIAMIASGNLITVDKSGMVQPQGSIGILALSIGQKQLITVSFFNKYGVKETPQLTWEIEKSAVASVVNNEITGLTAGTTQLGISTSGTSASISLTVVANPTAVASVLIAPPTSTNLQLNQTIQLVATAKDINNGILVGKTYEWFTENASIVSVTSAGLVTAIADGTAEVHAKVEGVKSNSIIFQVGAAGLRTGTFQSAGGYSTVGSVTAEEMGGKLVVKLSSNFQASVALGTYIYLANSTSGGNVKSAGLELGPWSSGATTFEKQGVTLNQYKYVVTLCKPAGITFGFAELKP